jgi:hypothetical protein
VLPVVVKCRIILILKTDKIYSWFQAFAVFWMLRVIFWVVPRCVVFNSRRFGTLCLYLPPQHNSLPSHTSYPLAYEDGTESVPKRRLLNTTRQGTTQNITRNKAKIYDVVTNKQNWVCLCRLLVAYIWYRPCYMSKDVCHREVRWQLVSFSSHLRYNTDSSWKISVNIFDQTIKKFPLITNQKTFACDNSPRHTTMSTCLTGLFLEYPS